MSKRANRSGVQPSAGAGGALTEGASAENEMAYIQGLTDLSQELKSRKSLEKKLRQAMKKTRELTDADLVFFCSVDRTADGHYAKAIWGDTGFNPSLLGLQLPAPPNRIDTESGAGDCILIHFEQTDSNAAPFADCLRRMGVVTGMAVPLQVKGCPLGFIFAGHRKAVTFSKAQGSLLLLIGNLVTSEIDRKQSEKEQKRLETILEQAAETIMITDREGVIQYVNPSFEMISGYKRQEVIGRRPNFLHSGRQSADFYKKMKKTLGAGEVWRGHLANRRKDGTLYELDATISPLKNERGEITDYVSVSKDVTQESLLRRQVYQAQKMEAVGTLAGGIAHDFNNLLMGIQGNISLMRMEIPQNHTHQSRCETIESYIKKGSDLTRHLLGVARNKNRRQIPTDISKLVMANLEMFGRANKEIRIHMVPDPRPCVAEVDPGQIDQVLLNLFVNAWQAMPEGGHIHAETQLVSGTGLQPAITGLKPEAQVKITIRDTGNGIDEAILDKIFDPFFTTKEKGKGTGLGLASAYGIIKNHGGIIQARSEKGHGATFEILLPASQKHSVETEKPEAPIAMGKETILLVDDEPSVLEICGEMLKFLGYRVITASTGSEALLKYESGQDDIDLVVLDVIMPGMRGEEVYELLVAINPRVRVLLASGYPLKGKTKELFSSRDVGFIQKPFSVTNLSQKVRETIAPGNIKTPL